MELVPGRLGVAGDWRGNTAWAPRGVGELAALLPADGPRVIVHLGDFGIWPGPGGQEYLARLDAALAEAGAELCFVDVTSMRWLRFAGRPISTVLRGLVSP